MAGELGPEPLDPAGPGHGGLALDDEALAVGHEGWRVVHLHLVAGLNVEGRVQADMGVQAFGRLLDLDRAGYLDGSASVEPVDDHRIVLPSGRRLAKAPALAGPK